MLDQMPHEFFTDRQSFTTQPTYNFSPQCGQYVFSFSISSEKPEANKPAGKAKKPIPKIAEMEPKNFPRVVIGNISQ